MTAGTRTDRTRRTRRIDPLAGLVGAGAPVPLVTGGTTPYANLDIAASAPALQAVADRVAEFLPHYSSVHRGAGYASAVSTAAYETARRTIGAFVGARPDDVVQVVRHTTDALNLLASAVPGDVVVLDIEHHANLLPWRANGVRTVPAHPTVAATLAALEHELARTPAALLAVTGASNVTGEILPLAELVAIAHRHGARIAVDGAQLVPHHRIHVAELGIDYLAFSGHKLFAPYGAGVLVGRRDWLDAAPPYLAGGGAVTHVTTDSVTWGAAPARHEAGTPNVVGAVALAAACEVLAALPDGALVRHDEDLRDRLIGRLEAIDGVRTLQLWRGEVDVLALATFTVEGHCAELVAQYLSAEHGIGVRDGRFCAHPLLRRLTGGATAVRASLGLGSSSDDVDRLADAIEDLVARGPRWTYGPDHLPTPDPRQLPAWVSVTDVTSACGS
ncbi:cysteine desulfurase [Nocardioides sp. Root190]|uniref:aminotransferase class V-fold PLP-dependent enzyme n=1 Tax=Nocardioides sp. Root190 TaxID=1736488 RepID=UPI0006FC3F40|nr:aminotransferase class V-fold PLP-dependent enzyme [Nocardioides sp. Root190]KRB72716.1 cysteine desulfurase [Nocardioides sp. Root190]